MTADPKPRKDGLCVVCKQKRVPPKNYKYRAEWKLDAFCSSVCCRIWHKAPIRGGMEDTVKAA